jgi:hypothetical protein
MSKSKISLPRTISDAFLIREFKKNSKHIEFIRYKPKHEREQRSKLLLQRIASLRENILLHKQREDVIDIWRYLIENAIVYLKSKDSREEYGHDDAAYGVSKLADFFRKFHEFEPLLYGAEKELYRDHITHMFSVFLLGDYLIRNYIKFDEVEIDTKALPISEGIKADEKEAMWCIMSLTHDLGYPLEGIPRISPKARTMLEAFGLVGSIQELSYSFPQRPLHDMLLKFISSDLLPKNKRKKSYITHMQSKYYLKFAEGLERSNHGVISCLVLMKNLVYFLETDYLLDSYKPLEERDARQFQIRRDILRSIASHSCDNIYYTNIPRFDFLLKIVDDMHEWGRPRFADLFVVEPLETSVRVDRFTTSEIEYSVTFKTRSHAFVSKEKERIKLNILSYFMTRCEGLFMTLRSAVGPAERKVKVTFEVVDKIGDPEHPRILKIVHKSPDEIELFDNSELTEWRKLKKEEDRGKRTKAVV